MVRPLQKRRKGRVWVVVLGDFGRSPRMQNHALSLAQQVSMWLEHAAITDLCQRGQHAALDTRVVT